MYVSLPRAFTLGPKVKRKLIASTDGRMVTTGSPYNMSLLADNDSDDYNDDDDAGKKETLFGAKCRWIG